MTDMQLRRHTRPIHPMPGFVKTALVKHKLLEPYYNRPPYQRNDYIGWINRAKQQKTREKRLTQMLDELTAGDSYMGMKYNAKRPERIVNYLGPEYVCMLATPYNLRLGAEIANANGVEMIESEPLHVIARVHPERGESRTVEFRATDKGLTWNCTCNSRGTFCKHCVAVVIKIMGDSPAC